MIIKPLFILLISISLTSIIATSPLPIGIVLLSSTLTFTIILLLAIPQWISIIVFIIYVGGIMVLLSYFLSLNPDHKLNPLKLVSVIFLFFLLTQITIELTPQSYCLLTSPITLTILNINLIYLILIGIILFLALVVVVSMTKKNEGPIRPHIII